MEYRLRPLVLWSFLQNNNHQAVKKMEWIENRKSKKYKEKNRWKFVWKITCSCKCVTKSLCEYVSNQEQ